MFVMGISPHFKREASNTCSMIMSVRSNEYGDALYGSCASTFLWLEYLKFFDVKSLLVLNLDIFDTLFFR